MIKIDKNICPKVDKIWQKFTKKCLNKGLLKGQQKKICPKVKNNISA